MPVAADCRGNSIFRPILCGDEYGRRQRRIPLPAPESAGALFPTDVSSISLVSVMWAGSGLRFGECGGAGARAHWSRARGDRLALRQLNRKIENRDYKQLISPRFASPDRSNRRPNALYPVDWTSFCSMLREISSHLVNLLACLQTSHYYMMVWSAPHLLEESYKDND